MDELVFSSGLGDDADDKDTYQAVRQTRAGWAGFLFLITFFAWDGADCPQYLHLKSHFAHFHRSCWESNGIGVEVVEEIVYSRRKAL